MNATTKTKSPSRSSQNPSPPSAGSLMFTLLVATGAAACAGVLMGWGLLDPAGPPLMAAGSGPPSIWQSRIMPLAGGTVVWLLSMILMWRVARPARRSLPAGPPASADQGPAEARAMVQARETRLFVHLLTRLQREGRLMDFLAEDLERYDDAQIGAAARSVHAGCRRVVEKLLAPRPVMTEGEEASVTVDEHYDATTLTLTGRVGDRPPFQGIVRHAGWRATRVDIPLLAEETDPAIIAPAEVEVVA